ncbi:MAG: hypothetical protein IPK73_24305 [Candidatus Obscuribacter sp.]|nr:hypothetical protein [Candidatus Obscuribacter sp.]MBK9277239.1 hypothetical protein [Candidatus Obscuribacter sp.]
MVTVSERSSASVTSTKQLVKCGAQICEERNGTGGVEKHFFRGGQTINNSNYLYSTDHLGSITEVCNSSGIIQSRYMYDLWGQSLQENSIVNSDFGFGAYYVNRRNELALTVFRMYSPRLGRWLSRDPVMERGGTNLYWYVANDASSLTDPSGLHPDLVQGTEELLGAGDKLICMCRNCLTGKEKEDCIAAAKQIKRELPLAWIRHFRIPLIASAFAGEQPCYQWAGHFNTVVNAHGGSVISASVERYGLAGYVLGAFEAHSAVHVRINKPLLGRKCDIYIDDGFADHRMSHHDFPVPPWGIWSPMPPALGGWF